MLQPNPLEPLNEGAVVQRLRLDSSLRDLETYDFEIEETSTTENLLQAFESNILLPGAILVSQGELSGFISRAKFLEILSRPFSRELFLQRTLSKLKSTQPTFYEYFTILPGDTSIFEAVKICLNRSVEALYEPIVIDMGEQTYRTLSIQDLVVAQAQICQVALLTIEERNAEILNQNERMRQYIQKVETLTAASIAVENGTFYPQQLNHIAVRTDELGRLAQVFQNMFQTVKARETELAEAKEHLEAVLNAVPGAIAWVDADGLFMGLNQYLSGFWDLPQDKFSGKSIGSLAGNNFQLAQSMQEFLASTQESASEVVECIINAELRYYLIVMQKYQQGNAAVFVGIDITERKTTEAALRLAEENYRSIFENALEGIFQASSQGQFIRVNPALAKIYGYNSPTEMLENITDIGAQLYVDSKRHREFEDYISLHDEVQDFEYCSYRKDGSIIWVEVNARAVKDDMGNLLYYEGIIQDITEQKHRERKLQRQLEALKIEIDQNKRDQQVEEISQTDYFKNLMAKINTLKSARKTNS